MKFNSILFFLVLLIFSVEGIAQDSVYFLQDYPTIRVIPVEKDMGVMDKPWFPSLLGSFLGSLFGFGTAMVVIWRNKKMTEKLREEDHYKDLLKQFYEAQAELTPLFVKLRNYAYELYFHNFQYNFNHLKAYQLEEGEKDEFEYLMKSKEENINKFNSKKEIYSLLAADSTKYFLVFLNQLDGADRIEFRRLMNLILINDFYVYDYFNPIGEDAEQEHYSTFYPLKNEIKNINIKEHFNKEISQPLQNLIIREIETIKKKTKDYKKSDS